MALTQAKIRQIELKAKKQVAQKSESSRLKIPDNWANFARLTKIRSGGDVKPFDPYVYQETLVKLMLERSVIVAKSRQLGISETITCFMLWRACLNPGYLGLVFSKTQTDSSLLARRMKRMIASLGLKTTTENLSDIEIQGYGRILFRNSKPDSARGIESVVDTFFDEFAFLDTAKEVYDALAPAQQMVGDKARVFVVSTPNGKSGFYWDLLSNGNENRDVETICEGLGKGYEKPFQYWVDSGGWGKVLIHWRSHPFFGSNLNFLQEVHEKQKLSWETIEREYNLSFSSADESVFDANLVRINATGVLEDYREKDALYYFGLDTSTTGADYTACVVLKYQNNLYSVTNIYRKRNQTSQYHIFQIGELINRYKPEVVAIETTGGVGVLYLEELSRQFKNIQFEGVKTTGDSKPVLISGLQLVLEKQCLTFPKDCLLVDELLSFRRSGKKLEASPGKHDDCVMALAFALSVTPFVVEPPKKLFDIKKLRTHSL